MENPFAALATDEGAQKDVEELFKFSNLVPDVKVKLNDSNFLDKRSEKFPSLIACSSTYGFFVTGTRTGFQLGQTKLLRETIYKADKGAEVPFDQVISVPVKEGAVDILVLTSDNLQLIVGVSGGILLTYNISDIVKNREEALPVHSQTLDADILFIQPNPEAHRDVIAVITQKKEAKLIRYMTSETIVTVPDVSSLCWSPLGKQFVIGALNGSLEAYDTNGNKKDTIDAPPSTDGMRVNVVVWLSSHVFLAIYSIHPISEEEVHKAFIINRKSAVPAEKYTLLDEVNPIYDIECPDSHFYYSVIRNFGKEAKTLITLANTAAESLAIVGESEDGSWATWIMGETNITMPLSDDEFFNTYPVGLVVDFSASEPLAPFDNAESETPVPPMPVVIFMTNVGCICAYHAYNFELAKSGIKYEKMVEAKDLHTIPEPAEGPVVPEATATVAAATTGGFGDAPTKIPSFSSFNVTSSSKPAPATNTATTTPSSSTPTFGSTSTMGFGTSGFAGTTGTEQKVSFATLAKSSSNITSASPPVSAFASAGTAPTFGKPSGFGVKADDNQPVFGSTTAVGGFGQASASGQTATPTFGKVSSSNSEQGTTAAGFGQTSTLGQTSTTPSFTQPSSFDSDSKTDSPFKAKGFGTSDTNADPIDPKNPFGAKSFAPASIDVDAVVKKASEEPAKKLTEEPPKDAPGAKSMFGLPSTPTLEKDKSSDSCTFSFESVKKDFDIEDDGDTSSEISKVSSIDKSRDAFGFSVPADDSHEPPVKKYDILEPVGEIENADSDYIQHDSDETESDEEDDIVVVDEEGLHKSTEKLGKRTLRKRYDQIKYESDDSTQETDERDDNDELIDSDGDEPSTINAKRPIKKETDDMKKGEESASKPSDEEKKKESDLNKEVEESKTADNTSGISEKERVVEDSKDEEQTVPEVQLSGEERIANEKKLEEERIEQEKKREEELKRLEEERIAEEKRREEERVAEEKRLEEERIAEEKRREEERIAEEKRLEEERIAEEKRREEERIAEEKRREEERIAEEKRREEERIAEEKRREEERIAEEERRKEEARRREEARLAAMRQPPIMEHRERTLQSTVHERAVGIKGIARDFESVYFDTVEDLESTSILISEIKQDISIQLKPDFTQKPISRLMEYDFMWRMDDMQDIGKMASSLEVNVDKAEKDLVDLHDSITALLDSTNNLKLEDVRSCLESDENVETIKSTLENDSENQISTLEAKSSAIKNKLDELAKKLEEVKQQINAHKAKSIDESKLTMYSLRRTIRDIERSIGEQSKKISILEQEELLLRSDKSVSSMSSQNKTFNQRKSFLNQMFQECKPLHVQTQ